MVYFYEMAYSLKSEGSIDLDDETKNNELYDSYSKHDITDKLPHNIAIHTNKTKNLTTYSTLDHTNKKVLHHSIIKHREAGYKDLISGEVFNTEHEEQSKVEKLSDGRLPRHYASSLTYEHIKNSGLPLRSSTKQQLDGHKMWHRMVGKALEDGLHVYHSNDGMLIHTNRENSESHLKDSFGSSMKNARNHMIISKVPLDTSKKITETTMFVLYQQHECEVINEGSNYLTLLYEGREQRIWKSDAVYVEGKAKRNQLYKESLIFKGYRTRNFNRNLSETFKEMSEASHAKDSYGFLNYVKAVDELLDVTEEMIEDDYLGALEIVERVDKYTVRFGYVPIVSAIRSLVNESCIKHAVIEGAKIAHTTTDKITIAKVIASVAGVSYESNAPELIVNDAIHKLKLSVLTDKGWILVGRLMQVATDAGITWNKELFSPNQLLQMGFKHDK